MKYKGSFLDIEHLLFYNVLLYKQNRQLARRDSRRMDSEAAKTFDIREIVAEILQTIEREREREIVARRFGLYERKETLEQIGELLGITRERVRQLEKAIMIRLKITAEKDLPNIQNIEKHFIRHLHDLGRIARVSDLANRIAGDTNHTTKSHVAFLACIAPGLCYIDENDNYFPAVGIAEYHSNKDIKKNVDEIHTFIKKHGQPIPLEDLHDKLNHEHPSHVNAHASVSKHLAELKGFWGLNKWPRVNPKNIRDKIFVILSENGKPMHFEDIAKAIRESDFKRREVTTQAIHNELIKDGRFVLIGRGIYALDEWGFSKGTVADIITNVLQKADEPLHRDEIVKRVLKHRQVKETTILLNLQGKPQFKRVAKATYVFAEA